jgi:multimeric flavodoxin WrbA
LTGAILSIFANNLNNPDVIMKKILGIVVSPRKLGNSEIMVKEISKHVEVPHELNLIRLSDFNIQSCRGCYQCLFKEGKCVLDDDLYEILDDPGF